MKSKRFSFLSPTPGAHHDQNGVAQIVVINRDQFNGGRPAMLAGHEEFPKRTIRRHWRSIRITAASEIKSVRHAGIINRILGQIPSNS